MLGMSDEIRAVFQLLGYYSILCQSEQRFGCWLIVEQPEEIKETDKERICVR
jgi:hypothetical protein